MRGKRDSIFLVENVSVGVAYAILILFAIWFIYTAAPLFGVGKPPQPVIVDIERGRSIVVKSSPVSVVPKRRTSVLRRYSQVPQSD